MHFWWANNRLHFNVYFWHNFNAWLIDATSTCFFYFFLKDKKSWSFYCHLLISFRYFKYESHFPVSFRCNLISMYFFKVISFYLEIFYGIKQCLRTVTLVDICSDPVCLQSQWFSTDVLQKFWGNGRRRHPFSVSCNNVFFQVFFSGGALLPWN